jgi:hypothetical protein
VRVMYLSWFFGPVLQTVLLILMLRRRSIFTFPLFFSYIALQAVKSVVLFSVYHYRSYDYFSAYWIGNGLSVLLALAVMDEVWRHLFQPFANVRRLGSLVFRWAAIVLILVAVIITFSTPELGSDRVSAAILNFDRSLRLMQCGLALLLILFSRQLRLSWKHPAVGIALGFGTFAAVEFLLVTSFTQSLTSIATASLIKSVAFNAVTLLWVFYLQKPYSASTPAFQVQVALGKTVPVGGAPAKSSNVIALVEESVERILNRGNWPRPATHRSRVIGQKPSSEERN